MIIYLHGFSSGANSHKAGIFEKYFKQYEISIPEYRSHQPRHSVGYLNDYVRQNAAMSKSPGIMLIGSSLGGYYAQYLANQHDFIFAAVLINPCLQPQITLASQIGEQLNCVTGKSFYFSEEDYESLAQYDVPRNKLIKSTLVLLDQGDEIIDYRFAQEKYKGKGRVIVYPGGDHWFKHLDQALPEIEMFYKTNVGENLRAR